MEVMTKYTGPKAKPKPPADPVASAHSMLQRIKDHPVHPPNFEVGAAMVQTVLIVRAIDRLTAAVKANTASRVTVIDEDGAEIPIVRDMTRQAEEDFAS
jgi:hypothetical protein